jgi:transketolase
VGDANDLEMLERAFRIFKNEKGRPTLIIVDSHIAYGAPNKQDTSAAHGEPLGEAEIRLAQRHYGWPEDAKFLVPDGRNSVLPPDVTARVAVEQASTLGWERYVGLRGRIIGMKTFGASASLKELQRRFGFEPERVVAAAKELLGKN